MTSKTVHLVNYIIIVTISRRHLWKRKQYSQLKAVKPIEIAVRQNFVFVESKEVKSFIMIVEKNNY